MGGTKAAGSAKESPYAADKDANTAALEPTLGKLWGLVVLPVALAAGSYAFLRQRERTGWTGLSPSALSSLQQVTLHPAGQQSAHDGSQPEQPELGHRIAAHPYGHAGAAGRIHRGVGHGDADQVDQYE